MKRIIIILTAALIAGPVYAQTTNSNSSSAATTNSTAGATNAGNAQAINFNSSGDGDQKLRTTPALGGQGFYGSFSQDSCTVSMGGGLSVISVGLQAAVPYEDKACSLRRNYERIMQASATTKDTDRSRRLETAAIDVLCQIDEKTRAALAGQGLCSDGQPQPVRATSSLRQDFDNLYTPG